MSDTNSLAGKNVLVVGGATGIGAAVACTLARAECHVAIAGRREDKLVQASQAYDGPGSIRHHAVDVADRGSVGRLVNWFLAEVGPIDVLVNSAGTNIKNRTMAQMRPEQWDQVLAINATGAYNCLAAVLPSMRERRQGIVIQINSISGKRATDLGGVAYCAAKFAMAGLGIAVGQEEAAHGIRVTNVYPGEVDTPILENRPHPVSDEHRSRMLQPQDVADVVLSIVRLPPRAHVPEIVIKPSPQPYF